jgi:peptidoglycan/LPS O-acetylase OafA/YrhL
MQDRVAAKSRDAALDGLRGLGMLGVLLHHATTHQLGAVGWGNHLALWPTITWQFRAGLVAFFVLSGYLLWVGFVRRLRDRSELGLRDYLKRRAARILPAYYLAMVGAVVLLWDSDVSYLLPPAEQLPLFAVFAQNYSPDTMLALNPPIWSLCVEVLFYALLPLFAIALVWKGVSLRGQFWILAGLAVFGIAWHALNLVIPGYIWQKALPTFLPYLAMGMALAVWRELPDRKREFAPRKVALIAIAGWLLVLGNGVWHALGVGSYDFRLIVQDLPAAIGFTLIVWAVLAYAKSASVSWLGWRPLAGLGVISYGVFLWHLPLMLWMRSVHPHGGLIETIALTFPLALAAGIASWFLIEKPALRRVGSRLAAKQQRGSEERRARRPIRPRPEPAADSV